MQLYKTVLQRSQHCEFTFSNIRVKNKGIPYKRNQYVFEVMLVLTYVQHWLCRKQVFRKLNINFHAQCCSIERFFTSTSVHRKNVQLAVNNMFQQKQLACEMQGAQRAVFCKQNSRYVFTFEQLRQRFIRKCFAKSQTNMCKNHKMCETEILSLFSFVKL